MAIAIQRLFDHTIVILTILATSVIVAWERSRLATHLIAVDRDFQFDSCQLCREKFDCHFSSKNLHDANTSFENWAINSRPLLRLLVYLEARVQAAKGREM
jgi:hypothetical protein